MSKEARFWDRIADKYAAKPVDDEAAYEDTLARTRAHLTGGETALEIGCGTGTTALKLAPFVQSIVATDVAGRMVEIAEEKRVAADVPNVSFERAGVDEDALPGGTFDVVFAFNFFHLASDVPAALAATASRIKPEGLMISKTGLLGEGPVYLRPMIAVMRLLGKAPPVASLTRSRFEAMVREAGFDILEAKTYPGIAPTRFLVVRKTEA